MGSFSSGRFNAVTVAQTFVASRLREGDVAVDATAGNGHDTVFLARRVGAAGRVYAVDVQAEAVEATRRRLAEERLDERVVLRRGGHESLATVFPEIRKRTVAAVMFNLGYLPGGDKTLTTRPDTTLAGLSGALECLAPRGLLAVVCYPGHPGGSDESSRVTAWAESLPSSEWRVLIGRFASGGNKTPFPAIVNRAG